MFCVFQDGNGVEEFHIFMGNESGNEIMLVGRHTQLSSSGI